MADNNNNNNNTAVYGSNGNDHSDDNGGVDDDVDPIQKEISTKKDSLQGIILALKGFLISDI
jgi:hypothetical protein